MTKHFDISTLQTLGTVFTSNLLGAVCGYRSVHIAHLATSNSCFIPENIFVLDAQKNTLGIVSSQAVETGTALSVYLLSKESFEQSYQFQEFDMEGLQTLLPQKGETTLLFPTQVNLLVQQSTKLADNNYIISAQIDSIYIHNEIIGHEGNLTLQDFDIVSRTNTKYFYTASPISVAIAEKHDSIVYDKETDTYNAAILPYSTNIGAPAIVPNDVSAWKNRGINRVNHHLKNQYDTLKEEYDKMTELYQWNDIIYGANINFEPIIGELYHLYKDNERVILSLISPDEWNKEHLGTFRLNVGQIWEKVEP